jgi:hypothetical protein
MASQRQTDVLYLEGRMEGYYYLIVSTQPGCGGGANPEITLLMRFFSCQRERAGVPSLVCRDRTLPLRLQGRTAWYNLAQLVEALPPNRNKILLLWSLTLILPRNITLTQCQALDCLGKEQVDCPAWPQEESVLRLIPCAVWLSSR